MRLAVGEGTSLMATGRCRKGERKMTEKQEKICAQYSAQDDSGKVHCCDCPLVVDREMMMCKKNAVYNRRTRRWEPKGDAYDAYKGNEPGGSRSISRG